MRWTQMDNFNKVLKKFMRKNQRNEWIAVSIAKRSYMSVYTYEAIEDAFMKSIEYVMDRCLKDKVYESKVTESTFTQKAHNLALREHRKALGLTQRGTIPKWGKSLHIQNYYDEDGNNAVEGMGYDEDGSLIIDR